MNLNMKTVLTALFMSVALMLSACGGKSDADIEKEVKSRVKTAGVNVAVKDGVVTLSGTVEKQDDSKAAETAAKGDGVKEVKNNIQIKPAATPMAAPATANANATGANANATGANANTKK